MDAFLDALVKAWNGAPGTIALVLIAVIAALLTHKAKKWGSRLVWLLVFLVASAGFLIRIEASRELGWVISVFIFGWVGWMFFREKSTANKVTGAILLFIAIVFLIAVAQAINGEGWFVDFLVWAGENLAFFGNLFNGALDQASAT